MERIITICLATEQRVEKYRSTALTWGEFLEEHPEVKAMSSGCAAHVKETRRLISGKETTLPEGDFTVFFHLEKVTSGNDEEEEIKQIIEEYLEILND